MQSLEHRWRWIAFGVVWAAFFAFGVYMRTLMPWEGIAELHGLDYTAHGVYFFPDWTRILQPGFRHPLFALFTAPLPLFGNRLLTIGRWPYWCFLFAVFSAVMACATMLVHSILKAAGAGRMAALAGGALFLSFSYTWLLAGCPESFPFACAAALVTLRWGLSPASGRGKGSNAIWCALAVLNGGITTTNGVKVVLAFLAARGITRRRIVRLLAICAALALAVLAAMWLRHLLFNLTHQAAKANLSDGWTRSLTSFCPRMDLGTWAGLCARFFSEPIVTHGDALTINHLSRPYAGFIAPVAVAALYAAAVAGAWRARRHALVKMVLAMFSVDALLHLAMGWGLDEGHIYCGHWLYAPALLAAMLPATLPERMRRYVAAALFALALAIFACGAHAFATAPAPDQGDAVKLAAQADLSSRTAEAMSF